MSGSCLKVGAARKAECALLSSYRLSVAPVEGSASKVSLKNFALREMMMMGSEHTGCSVSHTGTLGAMMMSLGRTVGTSGLCFAFVVDFDFGTLKNYLSAATLRCLTYCTGELQQVAADCSMLASGTSFSLVLREVK